MLISRNQLADLVKANRGIAAERLKCARELNRDFCLFRANENDDLKWMPIQ